MYGFFRVPLLAALLSMALGAGAVRAADTDPDPLAPPQLRAALEAARISISFENYDDAITRLQGIVATNPRNADAYSLLGYSQRKLKDYERSEGNYRRALRLDPQHRGALEYAGELYLETGRRPQAEEMFARLQKACPQGCEELEDLRGALAGGQSRATGW